MSSVGEISLLYINKAHVMNEHIVTRRMMLLYMASTVFSLTFTPLVLRLLVPTDSIVEKEASQGGQKYTIAVKRMVDMELELVAFNSSSDNPGLVDRRKRMDRVPPISLPPFASHRSSISCRLRCLTMSLPLFTTPELSIPMLMV